MKSRKTALVPGLMVMLWIGLLAATAGAAGLREPIVNKDWNEDYGWDMPLHLRSAADNMNEALIADYAFSEGSGSVVHDVSGVDPVMHLNISNPDGVTWLEDDALRIDDDDTMLWSEDKKIYDACLATDEITISAWIQPASLSMSGPARAVTFSDTIWARNFTIGTDNMNWIARLRTTSTSGNGMPDMSVKAVETRLQHIIYTRHASGDEFFYVNGVQETSGNRAGSFSNWDASHVFALGNEINPDHNRQFYGTYHRVSIYSKAISSKEVTALYAQGHRQINPMPSIRANGERGSLTVKRFERVTVTVTMAAGLAAGEGVDWFIIGVPHDGGDWYYLPPDMRDWIAFPPNMLDMCLPVSMGPLMNIYNPVTVLDRYRLMARGIYDFYFIADWPMNNTLDLIPDWYVSDMVRVVVE